MYEVLSCVRERERDRDRACVHVRAVLAGVHNT